MTRPLMVEGPAPTARPGVGAAVLVFRDLGVNDPEVLLGHRVGSLGHGTWGAPGGHVEPGETARAAAARELREETGVSCEPEDLAPSIYSEASIDGKQYVTLYFLVEFAAAAPAWLPPITESDKQDEWRWVPWSQLGVLQLLPMMRELWVRYPHPNCLIA